MGVGIDRRPPWYARVSIHAILAAGGVFFLLPLVWMISTSLKPLSQTMREPNSLTEAFLAIGYRATIDGKEYEVVQEREIPVHYMWTAESAGKGWSLSLDRPSPPAPGESWPCCLSALAEAGVLLSRLAQGPSADAAATCMAFCSQRLARQVPTPDECSLLQVLIQVIHAFLGHSWAEMAMPACIKTSAESYEKQQKLVWLRRIDEAGDRVRWVVAIDGRESQVVLNRHPNKAYSIVLPKKAFAAGELAFTFGPKEWSDNRAFNKQELARMDTEVTLQTKVLTDENNRFDPNADLLTLRSKTVVPCQVVRQVLPDPNGEKLWLVREWRPEDTDTKEMSSSVIDVTRAWDILPESGIRQVVREIPENYPAALRRVHFGRSLFNTLFLCAMCVAGSVVSSVIVAYGFAFLDFRGRKLLFALTLATIMIPFAVTMVPVYLMYRNLGWVGTFKPLWVASWFGSAFFIFLLRQFFLGLPKDLLDAARIDGCSELEILWNVVVPLSRPAIAMVALFTFLGTWKDFMGPMIYLNHPSQFTLSLSLQAFASEHGGTPWHLLMAASTVFSLPLIVLFFIAMKTFIRGVAMTGMKG